MIECGTQVEISAFHRKTSYEMKGSGWKEKTMICAKKKILLKYLVLEEKGVILLVLSTFSIHIKEY